MKGELRVCGTQMSGCEVWGYIWVCVAECFGCVWMIEGERVCVFCI